MAFRRLRPARRLRRQGCVSAADVRQRGADPPRVSARALCERRPPSSLDRCVAGRGSCDRLSRPDIYFPNVVQWCKKYVVPGNPLFVPEIRRGPSNPAYAFYTVSALGSLGISPFSIESTDEHELDPAATPLGRAYRLLHQLKPLILERQGQDSMAGVAPELDYDGSVRDNTQKVSLGGYTMTVTFEGIGSPNIFGVSTSPQETTEALPGAELPTLTASVARLLLRPPWLRHVRRLQRLNGFHWPRRRPPTARAFARRLVDLPGRRRVFGRRDGSRHHL